MIRAGQPSVVYGRNMQARGGDSDGTLSGRILAIESGLCCLEGAHSCNQGSLGGLSCMLVMSFLWSILECVEGSGPPS